MYAWYLCLVRHAKPSNTWSFLIYSEQTRFKTLQSLARLTGWDAGVPIEVQDAVDVWLNLKKYRKRQEQGQLGGRSHLKKLGARQGGRYTATVVATSGPGQVRAIREGTAGIREATCPEDRHHRFPPQAARTRQPEAGKSNGSGHGDSGHAAGHGLQQVVRTALNSGGVV